MRSRRRARPNKNSSESNASGGNGAANRSSGKGSGPDKGGAKRGPQGGNKGGKGGNRNQQSGRRNQGGNRRSNSRSKPSGPAPAEFWGRVADLPDVQTDLRLTDDPAAVPRSLGTPPLPGQEHVAGHYFRAVYDRAVHTAGALAAAGGLIDPSKLIAPDDDGED
jgi:hypothetical protein